MIAINELALTQDTSKFSKILNKLIEQTNSDIYDPFKELVWPEDIEQNKLWMSLNLMSVHGTRFEHELTQEQLIELSKWEFINFCSLNVTGIRELLVEMTGRLHTPGFEFLSEYLHYLIAEENEHMWYFSKFCLQYGKKIYPDRALAMANLPEADIANFMLFSRILIFEEIVDFYNRQMAKDSTLPKFIQDINKLHHADEGRHITYGRQYINLVCQELKNRYSEQRIMEIEIAVKSFMNLATQKLYRREIYADAGFEKPGQIRKELLANSVRHQFNNKLLERVTKFFTKIGLFSKPSTH
ncbi:diiron oxygenase [Dapis sp. BLCC M229]|uniref:diiron oxygenase n=1 Tax=Dapis sp. BLCC M229 TaxID=3400188 RepID=UPI003CEB21E3